MKQTIEKKTPEQMVEAVFALDLDPIKLKLMDKEEGHGWTRAEADHYELEYKRFLALLAKFPDEVIAPNKNVDKFWHGHILDTMKYAEDCQHVFGYFLHHFPYFGMRDEEDAANLAHAAVNMQRLYRQEFGVEEARARNDAGISATEIQQGQDTAYCGRASYCGAAVERAEAVQAGTAYCGRVSYCGAATTEGKNTVQADTAYCGRATSYCGAASQQKDMQADTSYCGRVSYCGAASTRDEAQPTQSAYCGRAAADDIIVAKGRPTLERVSETG